MRDRVAISWNAIAHCFREPSALPVDLYNARVKRRSFLKAGATGAAVQTTGFLAVAEQSQIPVIDSHIHLFDVSRPQGVPWPPKDSPVYKSALPDRYRKLATKHGVVGAIEIECSPWFADNQWVLDVAAKDSIIVGTIGDLEPGTPGFGKQLEQLHRNPLFRGIRYGNIWDRDLGKALSKPGFVADLKLLSEAGLVLDTANPDPALIHAALRVSDSAPNLTVVVDHLPELAPPEQANLRKACEDDLRLLDSVLRCSEKFPALCVVSMTVYPWILNFTGIGWIASGERLARTG